MSSAAVAAVHGALLCLLLHSLTAAAQSLLPPSIPRSDPYQYRLNGSMAVIIVILIAALFFIAFFSVYIRHCHDTSSQSPTLPPRAAAALRPNGLDPSLISSLPTLLYSDVKHHKIGKNALECAVCLGEFDDAETLRLIPKCDHVFHADCIDAWLESHSTCPVCRADLNRPELGDSDHRVSESNPEIGTEFDRVNDVEAQSHDVVLEKELPRGPRMFPRSHSTGHSLVQPGEDTERFTLRLPVEIRKQVVNRKLNRATSMVVFRRQGSSVRGYRFGSGEGSSRGKYFRRLSKSDRWVLSITPRFFTRMSSMKTTPRGGSNRGEPSLGSDREVLGPGNSSTDSSRLPV